MDFTIDQNDIKEIEDNEEKLAKWLMDNLSSFNACAFVLQTVMDGVTEAKEQMQ